MRRPDDPNLLRAWTDLHGRLDRIEALLTEERDARKRAEATAALLRSHVRRLRRAVLRVARDAPCRCTLDGVDECAPCEAERLAEESLAVAPPRGRA